MKESLKAKFTLTKIIVYVVLIISVMYFYEKSLPMTYFFKYYGNITTADTFTYPEEITSYAFGESDKEPFEIWFVNGLLCSAIDSGEPTQLIDVRQKHFEEYSFENDIPDIPLYPITQSNNITKVGVAAIEKIRLDEQNLIWSMEDVKPLESSNCYISAKATVKTLIFRIEKSLDFTGNIFQYIVP